MPHLPLQRALLAGREDHLPQAGGPRRRKGLAGAGGKGAGKAGGIVQPDVFGGQIREGVAGEIEPGAAVVVDDGKAEHRPVAGPVVALGVAVGLQQPVQAVVAQGHIVQQGAVPVPDQAFGAHGLPPYQKGITR